MSFENFTVLVVDDEEAMREVLRQRLASWGAKVLLAADAAEARRQLAAADVDALLTDVMLPDASGIELLREVRGENPDLPVVVITAHGAVDLAVDAMKEGAQDFLTKPLSYDQLKSVLEETQRELGRRRSARDLASDLDREETRFGELVGSSAAMREVYQRIREAAPTEAAVLISGESGTGKELTARTLHAHSRRAGEELVAINTAAIPKELMESEIFGHEKGAFTGATGTRRGCFELAHGGTLFLDEIAEMPLELQPKLLRVLEDGKVRRLGGSHEHRFDVRLLAATNKDPRQAVEKGLLREDLYYRINVFHVELPPLRQRREDIPLLAQHLLERFNAKHQTTVEGMDDDSRTLLRDYDWPGNVRELRNVVERAVVIAKEGWIQPPHLPPYVSAGSSHVAGGVPRLQAGMSIAEAEKMLILRTLESTGNNKAEAARQLGVDVKTVRNKLKRYGLMDG
jgi:DNA-binding NtrC family response regulator